MTILTLELSHSSGQIMTVTKLTSQQQSNGILFSRVLPVKACPLQSCITEQPLSCYFAVRKCISCCLSKVMPFNAHMSEAVEAANMANPTPCGPLLLRHSSRSTGSNTGSMSQSTYSGVPRSITFGHHQPHDHLTRKGSPRQLKSK